MIFMVLCHFCLHKYIDKPMFSLIIKHKIKFFTRHTHFDDRLLNVMRGVLYGNECRRNEAGNFEDLQRDK
ncbi:hypothetical protein D3C81_2167770 [compost metagenome]